MNLRIEEFENIQYFQSRKESRIAKCRAKGSPQVRECSRPRRKELPSSSSQLETPISSLFPEVPTSHIHKMATKGAG